MGKSAINPAVVGKHSTDIAALKNDLGIVEDGDTATHTIAQGQYVIWQGALYTADAAIASGTTLAASGGNKNLTAAENGGLNSLYSNIGNIENMLTLPLPSSNVEIGKYNGYTMKLGCFQWVGAVPTTGNVDVTSYFPVNGQYIIMMIVVCKLNTTDIFVGNTQGRVNGTKLTLYNAPTSSSATYQIYYWYYAT